MIDGVDVSDPEGGTIWLFANHNWIQEVQVIGLGATAEYGGFTGVASNSLFRSRQQRLPRAVRDALRERRADRQQHHDETPRGQTRVSDLRRRPTTSRTRRSRSAGPIQRDKLWFFTSFQYYRPKTAPAGYPADAAGRLPDVERGSDGAAREVSALSVQADA